MAEIGILDYDAGNLLSLTKALKKVGADCEIISSGQDLSSFEKLVIPGVGAFRDGMKSLEARGLVEPVRQFAASGKPILGICLGMQLFTEEGEEFGLHKGLGIVRGKTVSMKRFVSGNTALPHIGWNSIKKVEATWAGTPLQGIEEGEEVYFIHSYIVSLKDPKSMLASTEYGGCKFASVLRSKNIFGTQFHPEKSGETGLAILENFVNSVGRL